MDALDLHSAAAPSLEPFPFTLHDGLTLHDGARAEEPPPESRVREVARVHRPADSELACDAARGDAAAARAIWKRYTPLVRARLRRSLGTHDLDDHVQEVFLRLFERLPDLREPRALRYFLLGIAMRVAATELRRRQHHRLRLTDDGELPDSSATTIPDFEAKEALARFEAILAGLDARHRRAFELRYVEELDLLDISGALDTSLATVKRHLARVSGRVFTMVDRDPALGAYFRAANSHP